MRSPAQVRAEFDRIAETGRASGREHYLHWILKRAPRKVGRALDVGCGSGLLCAALAPRCDHILGVDLSDKMLDHARRRCAALTNVEFRQGDILEMEFGEGAPGADGVCDRGFDLIVSLATLHHMPLEAALERFKRWLNPGGMLLVVDLRRSVDWRDYAYDTLAAAMMGWRSLESVLPGEQRRARREVWKSHFRGDEYLSKGEAREVFAHVLPRSKVSRRLLWRWSAQCYHSRH